MPLKHARNRRWLYALHALGVLIATVQRGLLNPGGHNTFAIFRESFRHLREHQNLYAMYTATGNGLPDVYKYSPSAAVLFAPLAMLPFAVALLLWNAANVGLLIAALKRIVPEERINLALLLLLPEVFVAVQASSSNALVTALIILAAVAYEEGRLVKAGFAVVVGTSIKIFPLGGFIFALLQAKRTRSFLVAAAALGIVLALPLLVISPAELLQQYRWWLELESRDASDAMFGLSVMRGLRDWGNYQGPNWTVQLAGTVIFLVPLLLHRDRRADRSFRMQYLCSLLLFVVLFNHQAERQSFVIAATGGVLWFVASPRTVERAVLLGLALIGLPTFPYLVLWLVIHLELLRGQTSIELTAPVAIAPTSRRVPIGKYITGGFRAAS